MRALKGRYRLDAAIEQLQRRESKPLFVPVAMLNDLQLHMQDVDDALRNVKDECMNMRLRQSDTHGDQLSRVQHSLDAIEQLQRYQIDMIRQQIEYNHGTHCEEDVYTWMGMLPRMSNQYSFTISLLRKLHGAREQIDRQNTQVMHVELELLQAQCALLLSHAHNERQKILLATTAAETQRSSRRCPQRNHSWHGQTLTDKWVNAKLNCYLPFKLHGARIGRALTAAREADVDRRAALDEDAQIMHQLYELHDNRDTESRGAVRRCDYDDVYDQRWPNSNGDRRRTPSSQQRQIGHAPSPQTPQRPLSMIDQQRSQHRSPPQSHSGSNGYAIAQRQQIVRRQPSIPEQMVMPTPERHMSPVGRLNNTGQVRQLASVFDSCATSSEPPLPVHRPQPVQPSRLQWPTPQSTPKPQQRTVSLFRASQPPPPPPPAPATPTQRHRLPPSYAQACRAPSVDHLTRSPMHTSGIPQAPRSELPQRKLLHSPYALLNVAPPPSTSCGSASSSQYETMNSRPDTNRTSTHYVHTFYQQMQPPSAIGRAAKEAARKQFLFSNNVQQNKASPSSARNAAVSCACCDNFLQDSPLMCRRSVPSPSQPVLASNRPLAPLSRPGSSIATSNDKKFSWIARFKPTTKK